MKSKVKTPYILIIILLLIPSIIISQEDFIHLNKVAAKLERDKLVTGIWVQSVNLSNAIGIIEFNGYPTDEQALNRPMIDFILIVPLLSIVQGESLHFLYVHHRDQPVLGIIHNTE